MSRTTHSFWACVVLAGCGAGTVPSGIAWTSAEVDVGEVTLGREWTGEASWRVEGSAEFVGLKSSCGCTRAALQSAGHEVRPGPVVPGTNGIAQIGIKADGHAGPKRETISILWRVSPTAPVQVSVLQLKATLVEAYTVAPRAVLVTDASRVESVPFIVEWQPLRPTSGTARLGQLPGQVVVAGVEQVANSDAIRYRVQGMVKPPNSGREQEFFFSLQLEGLSPPAPPVPVKVQYQRLVEVRPFGLLELRPQDSGHASARATVRVSVDAGSVRVRGHHLEPTSLDGRVEIGVGDLADSHLPVDVRLATREDSFVRGTVVIDVEPRELGPIEIPWIYLKKSTELPAGGVPADPAVHKDSTRGK